MALGILIGALLHKNATGKELTYTPNKDFIGQETISMDYGESDPREFTIYTVSNSAKQKIFIDSLGKDAIVTLVNKAITFTPPDIPLRSSTLSL